MANSKKEAFEYDSTYNYKTSVSVTANPISPKNIVVDINSNFEFLKEELQTKLDEVMKEIDDTLAIDAFVFDSVKDLSKARDELNQLVTTLKSDLDTLYSTFETDINNVITEVENDFNWASECTITVTETKEEIPQSQPTS